MNASAVAQPSNVLLIIGDDMGVDALSVYGVSSDTAYTPTLDRLAEQGLVFEHFWSQPACSPTRAEMLTGRHGFRTGVLRQITRATNGDIPPSPDPPEGSPREGRRGPPAALLNAPTLSVVRGLSRDEFTLPMALKVGDRPYATAAIGKWHLADTRNGWLSHPNIAGFDHYAGAFLGFPEGYFAWLKNTNGEYAVAEGYGISDKVNDAIRWIDEQGSDPWFLWLAFNSPHYPLHKPPIELINSPELKELDPGAYPPDNPRPYFKAMIEAMDSEIGRLLDTMDDDVAQNTVVIFLGDNGSTGETISGPLDPAGSKGTVYQGGINTPLIVSGRGIAQGRVERGLAKSVDIFATVIELSGEMLADVVPEGVEIDGQSLVPYFSDPSRASLRRYSYVDWLPVDATDLIGDYAIRNERHKYLVAGGNEALFDLVSDPFERRNLLDNRLADAEISAIRDELRREVRRMRPGIHTAGE